MATCDITAPNDADFSRVFQYKTLAGVPINITGAVMWMMLRRRAADLTSVMRLATDTGEITLIDAVNGKWSIFIEQEQLERIGVGEYAHSLIMELNGVKQEIWSGTFTNKAGPSR